MNCVAYDESSASVWDGFVLNVALNGTFLHTRRYLSYHDDRFKDRSFLVLDDKNKIIAIFPAAEHPSDAKAVVSHPGITYGGLVAGCHCRGEICVNALQQLKECYLAYGYRRLVYKAVPHIYAKQPFQDDLYALFRLGAIRSRCDLSACVDLEFRGKVSSRRKRGYKKAIKSGVDISTGIEVAAPLWDVLSDNLERKHGVKPVHSLNEILELKHRFSDSIEFVVAQLNGGVMAGVVLFENPVVSHAQYIASSEAGYANSALDVVFEYCIAQATNSGRRYFDFGISNEDHGRVLNGGLYQFKTEFGAGSVVHEFYEIDLENM